MFVLARYLKKYWKMAVAGPFFKLIEAIFELVVPLVMARIIDVGIPARDVGYIWRMGGVMVLLGFTGLACAVFCQYCAARVSQGFGNTVRSSLFSHINALSHAEIDKIGTPSLITRITNDVNQVQLAVAMMIRLAVRAPFLVVGSAVMALRIDWKVAVVFLIAAPLVAVVLYFIMGRSVPLYKTIQRHLDRISLITRENLTGARVIRAFSRQEEEQARFHEETEALKRDSLRVGKISALLSPVTFLIINLSIVAIVWLGGRQVNVGALTQGEVYAMVNYMMQNLLALIVVSNLVVIFTKASASGARIQEVFDASPSISDAGCQPVQPVAGAPKIQFDTVSFSYPGSSEPSLTDISFSAARGETIGVIGGTGSGKSTLVNLIPRFYDVSQGQILIDGVDVKAYPFWQLRGQIGIVPQSAALFTGTIRDNMQWRRQDATEVQISRALTIAQASEFIKKLSDGLDHPILQGGKNLSGGQKQRLTIARALVGDPQILILDDSASALDFATDAALRRAIRENTTDMTVLLVSQRINTVKNADRILVLDEGRIVDSGTHAQLLDRCDIYREICLSQLSAEEVRRG